MKETVQFKVYWTNWKTKFIEIAIKSDFNESYCKFRVSPISEIVFNQLKTIYKQENHAFSTI